MNKSKANMSLKEEIEHLLEEYYDLAANQNAVPSPQYYAGVILDLFTSREKQIERETREKVISEFIEYAFNPETGRYYYTEEELGHNKAILKFNLNKCAEEYLDELSAKEEDKSNG